MWVPVNYFNTLILAGCSHGGVDKTRSLGLAEMGSGESQFHQIIGDDSVGLDHNQTVKSGQQQRLLSVYGGRQWPENLPVHVNGRENQ